MKRRYIYSSCKSEGVNVTDLEEWTYYYVYVTTFNKYGITEGSLGVLAFSREKGICIMQIVYRSKRITHKYI